MSGCPFAGGGNAPEMVHDDNNNPENDKPEATKEMTNGSLKAVYESFKLNENTSRSIPKGGMLYGDYLQVFIDLFLKRFG